MYQISFLLDANKEFPASSPLAGKDVRNARMVFGKINGVELSIHSVEVSQFSDYILEQADIKLARTLSDLVDRKVIVVSKNGTPLDATSVLKLASIYTRT